MAENIVQIPKPSFMRRGLFLWLGVKTLGPLKYFKNLVRKTGSYVTLRVADGNSLSLSDRVSIEHVLKKKYPKGAPAEFLVPVVGEGVFLTEGEKHLKQRRIAARSFAPRNHQAIFAQMIAATEEIFDQWQVAADKQKPVDLAQEFPKLSFRVLVRALFHEEAQATTEKMQTALKIIFDEAGRRLWLPKKEPAEEVYKQPKFHDARQTLYDEADGMVARRLEALRNPNFEHKDDLLSDMVSHYSQFFASPETEKEARKILREEVITYLVAGHETTGQALSFTMLLLAKNSDAFKKMRAEVDTVLGAEPPTLADVKRLTDTANVFSEALRLYPVAWVLRRMAPDENKIPLQNGDVIAIPRGHLVMVSPWTAHRLERTWGPTAEAFNPDRFNDPIPVNAAYFPFADGHRNCIGEAVARLEATVVLARMVQRFNVRVLDPGSIGVHAGLILRPDRPMMAEITKRQDQHVAT